jgi:hypothetical protein
MGDPVPNIELVIKTMAYVQYRPTLWTSAWSVETDGGTARNFLGTALYLADIEPVEVVDDADDLLNACLAQHVLGITGEEAAKLCRVKDPERLWTAFLAVTVRYAIVMQLGSVPDDLERLWALLYGCGPVISD